MKPVCNYYGVLHIDHIIYLHFPAIRAKVLYNFSCLQTYICISVGRGVNKGISKPLFEYHAAGDRTCSVNDDLIL